MTPIDQRFMRLALALGSRGLGRVWPNPAVGCIVVKHGRVVGRGWTAPGGRPHAEPQALAQAGNHAEGSTVYVTLEPCSHHGKTPPCAEALIAEKVSRVVVAATDPDPRVSGRGIKMLRDAGITVETGVLEDEANATHAGFFSRIVNSRPFVTLKLAQSFDGRIATGSGHSQWITGPQSRRLTHALRSRHDAVMVGAGTARADDPMLNVRNLGTSHQPVRVLLSRRLQVPLDGKLAQSAQEIPLWICHESSAAADLAARWQQIGARLLPCKTVGSQLDMGSVLASLANAGLTRVFCEGGSSLAASLIEADCVDELVSFTAGFAIGAEGLPGIGAMGLSDLAQAKRFRLKTSKPVGGDLFHVWERT